MNKKTIKLEKINNKVQTCQSKKHIQLNRLPNKEAKVLIKLHQNQTVLIQLPSLQLSQLNFQDMESIN